MLVADASEGQRRSGIKVLGALRWVVARRLYAIKHAGLF